jgi:hypothetical protein
LNLLADIIKISIVWKLSVLQPIILSLYRILSYLEIYYLCGRCVQTKGGRVYLISKILNLPSRLLSIFFEIHIFTVSPKLYSEILKELINFLIRLTITYSFVAFINVYINLGVPHVETIISHVKLTWVFEISTYNSLITPSIKKININLFIPEITLCAPFDRDSSGWWIETYI